MRPKPHCVKRGEGAAFYRTGLTFGTVEPEHSAIYVDLFVLGVNDCLLRRGAHRY